MKYFTQRQYEQLRINGFRRLWSRKKGLALELEPVVKLFTPDAQFTWLLSEIDVNDHDRAFCLCDLDYEGPWLGYMSLSELGLTEGASYGLPVERDDGFEARKTLSQYAAEALREGRIIA